MAWYQGAACESYAGIPPERLSRTHHQGTRGQEFTERFLLCLKAFMASPTSPSTSAPRVGGPFWRISSREILTTEEIHRFPNEPVVYGGSLHWDAPRLWLEVRKALARLGEGELAGIGVDAWGVDYALLGENGELLQNPYHYRDRRTEGVMEEVLREVSKEEIYKATGIQFMASNTLYQL